MSLSVVIFRAASTAVPCSVWLFRPAIAGQSYTISFDHAAYDEASIAREMAQRVEADQEVLNLEAEDLYGENYIKTVWHSERTFYNTLGVAKYCMSRRVRESGYKVVVTGEGADELYGGYPAFKRDMFRFGLDASSAGRGSEYLSNMDEKNRLFKGAILSEEFLSHPALDEKCGFTPSWIQPWMQTLEIVRPLLHDDIQHEIRITIPSQPSPTRLTAVKSRAVIPWM